MDKNMDRPIEDMRLAQIGFLVNDIEKTKKGICPFFWGGGTGDCKQR